MIPLPGAPPRGYSVFIGPALAYEFNQHTWSDTGIKDTYGAIHVLGPSMHWTAY